MNVTLETDLSISIWQILNSTANQTCRNIIFNSSVCFQPQAVSRYKPSHLVLLQDYLPAGQVDNPPPTPHHHDIKTSWLARFQHHSQIWQPIPAVAMSYLPSFRPSAISHRVPWALFHPLIPSPAPLSSLCSAPTGRDPGLFMSLPCCQLLSRPETKPRPQIAMICNVTPGEDASGGVGIIKSSSQNRRAKTAQTTDTSAAEESQNGEMPVVERTMGKDNWTRVHNYSKNKNIQSN